MSIDVFNRYEKKYLLDQAIYEAIASQLCERMTLDVYNKEAGFYTISNLYFDTVDDALIKKSLSKPIYKEKLRLRAYGVPDLDSIVFLEIKKKVDGLVNKRRTSMTLSEAYAFIETGQIPAKKPYHNSQVIREIAYFMEMYDLKPASYIAYDRKALFAGDLRITFDTHIRSRRESLGLEYGDYGKPLLEPGMWLMEVKASTAFPLWFVKLLSEYRINASSFSKYGKEYLTRDQEMKGEHMTCLSHYLIQQGQPLTH